MKVFCVRLISTGSIRQSIHSQSPLHQEDRGKHIPNRAQAVFIDLGETWLDERNVFTLQRFVARDRSVGAGVPESNLHLAG